MYPLTGFKLDSINVSDFDANNFLRALDSGLVKDVGGGRYCCPKSATFEQIFWEGKKSIIPRPITLWNEPIITIGTIARLGLDFGWREETLCMQTKDGAFDFAIFKEACDQTEFVAGEVKKSEKEIDLLIADLIEFGEVGKTDCVNEPSKRMNSFKKWRALIERKAEFFWAVGPNNYSALYLMKYKAGDIAEFLQVPLDTIKRT